MPIRKTKTKLGGKYRLGRYFKRILILENRLWVSYINLCDLTGLSEVQYRRLQGVSPL